MICLLADGVKRVTGSSLQVTYVRVDSLLAAATTWVINIYPGMPAGRANWEIKIYDPLIARRAGAQCAVAEVRLEVQNEPALGGMGRSMGN